MLILLEEGLDISCQVFVICKYSEVPYTQCSIITELDLLPTAFSFRYYYSPDQEIRCLEDCELFPEVKPHTHVL